jgi:outer membrane protein assembly factor BamB
LHDAPLRWRLAYPATLAAQEEDSSLRLTHRLRHSTTAGIVLAFVAAACSPEAASAPTPAASASAQPIESELLVLPNNTVLQCGPSKIVAVHREGDVAWELTVPYGDALIAPAAVGLNSVAYFRGTKGVYAALPDGKWAWSKPLESRSTIKSRASDTPVTFPDSTVAVAVGDDIVRFDDKGVVRWRLALPEGHVNARMSAGMDGALFVPTSAGLYCISPEGNVAWKRANAG